MGDVSIRRADAGEPAVLELLLASDMYYADLYPAASNHLLGVNDLQRRGVSFIVATAALQIIGCGAIVLHGDYAEIKRMYVSETYRGKGIGKKLLHALERCARDDRVAIIRLETGIRQPEALRLYRTNGYTPIAPFGAYKTDPLSVFMEKQL